MKLDIPGSRINPPSNAKTSPAPLLVHTEYLSPFSAASLALVYWDHQP
jgi:hypothetical protein